LTSHVRISAREAHALLAQGYVFLDVRSEPEFALGHPAGAYNIPLQHNTERGREDNADFLRVVRAVFEPDSKLIVGCRTGERSLRASAMLQQAGYSSVVEQRSGFDGSRDPFGRVTEPGWRAEGLPCSEDAEGRDYASLERRA
jgi:rhodanese-related sulfurtransferase